MALDVKVIPGAAAVLRYGPVIAVTAMTGGEALADLRETIRTAAQSEDAAAMLFGALADGDPRVPLAVVVAGVDGADVVLLGDLDVHAETMAGVTHLNGRATAGAIKQTVAGPLTRISIGAIGTEIPEGFGLEAGVVPGGGAVVVVSPDGPVEKPTEVLTSRTLPSVAAPLPVHSAGPATEAPAAATPAPDAEPAFEAVELAAPSGVASRAPLPLSDQAAPAGSDAGAEQRRAVPQVLGVKCKVGHFNHPEAVNCAWCGRGMLQVSRIAVEGPRPPLGVLVVNEQATFTLDADYVVGRMPSRSPDVDGETVRELVLADPDRLVSRVHARITLRDWNVTVIDGGSGMGTWVQSPDRLHPPHRLTANQPYPLRPGEHIQIGRHRLTFHSHHLI